jgi:hypothetical protein
MTVHVEPQINVKTMNEINTEPGRSVEECPSVGSPWAKSRGFIDRQDSRWTQSAANQSAVKIDKSRLS